MPTLAVLACPLLCVPAVRFREAIDYFNKALWGAVSMQGAAGIWAGTHCNLGHAYRQLL
jgi:hypothetical protein